MPHSLDLDRLQELFDEMESDDRLSKWERGFVDSVYAQWDDGKILSEAQLEKLEQIWVRLT